MKLCDSVIIFVISGILGISIVPVQCKTIRDNKVHAATVSPELAKEYTGMEYEAFLKLSLAQKRAVIASYTPSVQAESTR